MGLPNNPGNNTDMQPKCGLQSKCISVEDAQREFEGFDISKIDDRTKDMMDDSMELRNTRTEEGERAVGLIPKDGYDLYLDGELMNSKLLLAGDTEDIRVVNHDESGVQILVTDSEGRVQTISTKVNSLGNIINNAVPYDDRTNGEVNIDDILNQIM